MCDNNYVSSTGNTCQHYHDKDWCTANGGYGTGWLRSYGKFADWADPSTGLNALACKVCGCCVQGEMLDNSYAGDISTTPSGKECINWMSAPDKFTKPTVNHNKCRSVTTHNAWCWTSITTWEYCHCLTSSTF